jgi:hypothetical protein
LLRESQPRDVEHGRHPIEIANLAKVEEAISTYVEQGRSLRPGLVLDLHNMLMTAVPPRPKRPLKPGRYRDATDKVRAKGVAFLSEHMSPPWRIETDVVNLLDDLDQGSLGEHNLEAAGRAHVNVSKVVGLVFLPRRGRPS